MSPIQVRSEGREEAETNLVLIRFINAVRVVYLGAAQPAFALALGGEIANLAHARLRIQAVGYCLARRSDGRLGHGGVDGLFVGALDLVVALAACFGAKNVSCCGAEDELDHYLACPLIPVRVKVLHQPTAKARRSLLATVKG